MPQRGQVVPPAVAFSMRYNGLTFGLRPLLSDWVAIPGLRRASGSTSQSLVLQTHPAEMALRAPVRPNPTVFRQSIDKECARPVPPEEGTSGSGNSPFF